MSKRLFSTLAICGLLVVLLLPAGRVRAAVPGNEHFAQTWERTDLPVADGEVARTWMWGPHASTGLLVEPYQESPGGMRTVQYFDKSRMEITHADADSSSPWYVTNGLLAMELITGSVQVGDALFEERGPAEVNVAGDAADLAGPTYATFRTVLDAKPLPVGSGDVHVGISWAIDRQGNVEDSKRWGDYGVTTAYHDETTNHTIARPFWEFMNSSGIVWESGGYLEAPLFPNAFFATGRPVTEAYWAEVLVGGAPTDVLIQCFERRCLTYTPSNSEGWRVESGNIGQHYYQWRCGALPGENQVETTIPVGEAGIEYRFGTEPPPDTLNYGPHAFSIAPDGTFWVVDLARVRLAHFDRAGQRLGAIELEPRGARSIVDVDASSGEIWVVFANLDAGIWKVMRFSAEGDVLFDEDLPESLRDIATIDADIVVNERGEVYLQLDLGLRYIRLVDASGNVLGAEADALYVQGHTFAVVPGDNPFDGQTIRVDGHGLGFVPEDEAFALEVGFIGAPSSDRFYAKAYQVADAGIEYDLYEISPAGIFIAEGTANELERAFVYVRHPYAIDPTDEALYVMVTHADRVEIRRVAFG